MTSKEDSEPALTPRQIAALKKRENMLPVLKRMKEAKISEICILNDIKFDKQNDTSDVVYRGGKSGEHVLTVNALSAASALIENGASVQDALTLVGFDLWHYCSVDRAAARDREHKFFPIREYLSYSSALQRQEFLKKITRQSKFDERLNAENAKWLLERKHPTEYAQKQHVVVTQVSMVILAAIKDLVSSNVISDAQFDAITEAVESIDRDSMTQMQMPGSQ